MIAEDNTWVLKGPPPSEPLPNIALSRIIFNTFQSHAKAAALVDVTTGETRTYDDLLSKSVRLARSLQVARCSSNTTIAICAENSIDFFTPILAAIFIGAPVAPINHQYTAEELLYSLTLYKPKILFTSAKSLEKFLQLRKALRFIHRIIIIDDITIKGFDNLETLGNKFGGDFKNFKLVDVDPEQHPAFLLSSSGTTGLPKGVIITQKNIIAKLLHVKEFRASRPADYEADGMLLGYLPFFHAYGLFYSIFSMVGGRTILVFPQFNERIFLQSIEKYRIRELAIVPPLAVFLAKSPLVDQFDLSSVKEISCGAAPLSKNVQDQLMKRFNIDTIKQAYGLTETTLSAIAFSPIGETKPGSVGKLLSMMECKVRQPETGRSLGPGQVGELCFKGPIVMKGYYNNPEATRLTFTEDGWLLTGDLGYYDTDEFFYIVDRLKELIKYKGFQVAPAELEAVLLRHGEVKEAGVVGIEDEVAGELPMAFVVKIEGSRLSEAQLEQFVAEHVSSPKRLRGGVVFVDAIPKTPSGKILRRELKKMAIRKSKL